MNEPVRMVADALQDGTIGVNALLPGIPRDGGDAQPANIATFLDITRDKSVARGHLTQNVLAPALIVGEPDDVDSVGWVTTQYMDFDSWPVSVALLDRDEDSAVPATAAGYYRRAVLRCISNLLLPANVAARQRNSVTILNITNLRIAPPYSTAEDTVMVWNLEFRFNVRDEAPYS